LPGGYALRNFGRRNSHAKMLTTEPKPGHVPVRAYYASLAGLHILALKHEPVVRSTFHAPMFAPAKRADHLKKQQAAFLGHVALEAREIVTDLKEKYTRDGEIHLTLPDGLKVPPT